MHNFRADDIIISDLASLPIEMVLPRGGIVAEAGKLAADLPPWPYPDFAKGTAKLGKALGANRLAEVGGGIVDSNGEVLALVELPVATLMKAHGAPFRGEGASG
ncbi:MAG: hypothetical protein Q8L54_08740 [Devosia sp.]|nr:hypothetical protein [Devosia sp.]